MSKLQTKRAGKRFALYNHKGGVGKTTLTINIAAALAELGKRVLLVDTDPQCNLTSYLVEPNVIDTWLDTSDTDRGITIWSALKPFMESGNLPAYIEPVERLPNIFLLPGDIRLADFEQDLGTTWTECLERKPRGFKGASAISQIVKAIIEKKKIDYVFYDVGPNVGPLNRIILLDCDYFIVPAACDIFSVRALKTLGKSLDDWIRVWEIISQLAPDNTLVLPGKPKFLGYILQRFRIYGGAISGKFTPYIAHLEKSANSDIAMVLRKIDKNLASGTLSQNKLGQVKDFGALAVSAQEEGKAFFDISKGDPVQKKQAKEEFLKIANNIISLAVD